MTAPAAVEAPKRTGKPPESVNLAGMLVPWNGPAPALLAMPASDALYIPCFADVTDLRELMVFADCPYTSVKQIEDGAEFLASIPFESGGRPLHVILNPRVTEEGKIRFVQVFPSSPPESTGKPELLALVARMREVSNRTYNLFFRTGMGGEVHAFIEFCGVLSKYVDICQRCAEEGIDFRYLNTHSGRSLPVFDHDMGYLGEKLDCIFGPAIQSNPESRLALMKALFGAPAEPPGDDTPEERLARLQHLAAELRSEGYHVIVREPGGSVLEEQ